MRFEPVNSDRERADPVLAVRVDEVGQAHVGAAFALLHLLAEERDADFLVAGRDQHIVVLAAAAPQADCRRAPAASARR